MPGEDSHLPVGARLQAHVGRRPSAGVRDRRSQHKHKQVANRVLLVFALRSPIPARAPRGPTGGAWRRMYHQVFFVAFVASCSSC
jgi:hypothetical protein